jgi:SEC-C motif-containing protein
MRSRYAAFVLGDADYLLASWHPSTRPERLDLADDRTQWLGLKIKHCIDGDEADDEGRVEFVARLREGGRAHRLHETSRFVREDGRWLYLDGELHGDER